MLTSLFKHGTSHYNNSNYLNVFKIKPAEKLYTCIYTVNGRKWKRNERKKERKKKRARERDVKQCKKIHYMNSCMCFAK